MFQAVKVASVRSRIPPWRFQVPSCCLRKTLFYFFFVQKRRSLSTCVVDEVGSRLVPEQSYLATKLTRIR